VASLYSTTPINLAAPNQNPSFYNGPYVGAASAPTTNVSGINDLAILEIPMEFDFKIGPGVHTSSDPKGMTETTGWSLPIRFFADFAYNVNADERSQQARDAITGAEAKNFVGSSSTGNVGVTLANTTTTSPTGATSNAMTAANVATNKSMFASAPFQGVLNSGQGFLDQAAYQVGIEAGQLKKKGDWDGKVYWQSTGYYALDPNLVPETFNGASNLEGIVLAVSHEWTDGLSSTVTYVHANPVNGKIATPNINQDLTLDDIRTFNLLQADLTWAF
jgi:hypothetical protein